MGKDYLFQKKLSFPTTNCLIIVFALFLLLLPVRTEALSTSKLQSSFEIISVSEDGESPADRDIILAMGLAGGGTGDTVFSPWLDLSAPLDQNNDIIVNYQTRSNYSLGVGLRYDSSASLVFMAGKGSGPQGKDGVSIGFSDVKRLNRAIELFGKYYPVTYLFDSHDWSWLGVWEVGTRLSHRDVGISYFAYGDSANFGSRYRIDFTPGNFTVIMGYSTIEKEPDFSLGVRVSF